MTEDVKARAFRTLLIETDRLPNAGNRVLQISVEICGASPDVVIVPVHAFRKRRRREDQQGNRQQREERQFPIEKKQHDHNADERQRSREHGFEAIDENSLDMFRT